MTTISSTDKNITLESLFSLLAPHWLAGNLLLAMAYFLTGNLGLLLAIPPGFATAVWPASGIALGWILLYGWRLLPGVVCGSCKIGLFGGLAIVWGLDFYAFIFDLEYPKSFFRP
jgi:hypothetical protein